MREEFFNIEFQRDFVCLIISVPLGVLIGVMVNQTWGQLRRTEEKRQLAESLVKNLKDNQRYLTQIVEYIEKDIIPTFLLDMGVLVATTAKRYEVFDDYDLCRKIDTVHFELAHVARTLDTLYGLHFNPASRNLVMSQGKMTSVYNELVPPLKDPLRTRAESTKKLIADLLPKLEGVSREAPAPL